MTIDQLTDELSCTGCSMCVDVCKKGAIRLHINKEGFIFPHIDTDLCVECKQCIAKCPVKNKLQGNAPLRTVVAYSKSNSIYLNSSSGGIFGQFVNNLLSQGWNAVGAESQDDTLEVKHTIISNINDINRIQGSKYVQSRTDGIYKEILDLLNKGERVLFSGTPCQCAALRSFVGNRYHQRLIVVDIICHGVSNEKFLKKCLEKQYGYPASKMAYIKFRIKDDYERSGFNMTLHINDDIKFIPSFRNLYYSWYLRGLIYRNSCYECQFANVRRIGDITLGDCNTYKRYRCLHEEKSLSIVLLNTPLGQRLWGECAEEFAFMEADLEAEVSTNAQLHEPSKKPQARNTIFEDFDKLSFSKLKKKYMRISLKKEISYILKRNIKLKYRIRIKNMLNHRTN